MIIIFPGDDTSPYLGVGTILAHFAHFHNSGIEPVWINRLNNLVKLGMMLLMVPFSILSIWLLLPDPNVFSSLNHINQKKKSWPDYEGDTLLHIAVMNWYAQHEHIIMHETVILLEMYPNIQNREGYTPPYIAVRNRYVQQKISKHLSCGKCNLGWHFPISLLHTVY